MKWCGGRVSSTGTNYEYYYIDKLFFFSFALWHLLSIHVDRFIALHHMIFWVYLTYLCGERERKRGRGMLSKVNTQLENCNPTVATVYIERYPVRIKNSNVIGSAALWRRSTHPVGFINLERCSTIFQDVTTDALFIYSFYFFQRKNSLYAVICQLQMSKDLLPKLSWTIPEGQSLILLQRTDSWLSIISCSRSD